MTLSCARARELASELIDGELPDELATAVREHVATCPSCPQLYRSLVLVHEHLATPAALVDEAASAALARLRSRLRGEGR